MQYALLREFGDAEVAHLIAPRGLAVEAARFPQVAGPPPATAQRNGAAPGAIVTPPLISEGSEVDRARSFFSSLHASERLRFLVSGNGEGPLGSEEAVSALLQAMARVNWHCSIF
jgi:hypothetical protein